MKFETVLFGAKWCPNCLQAKKYLTDHQKEFTYLDIDVPENKERLIALGYRSIPILTDGEAVVVGFDSSQYDDFF